MSYRRGVALIVGLMLALCAACTPTSAETPFYAPDFTLAALNGTSYTLSELRGQWVIVTFWATTCPPCMEDLPLLKQLAYEADGQLVVLGINMRESPETIMVFLAPLQIDFPILLDPYDQLLLDYNVIGLPQTLLIDPTGEVRERRFGPVDTQAWEDIMQKQT